MNSLATRTGGPMRRRSMPAASSRAARAGVLVLSAALSACTFQETTPALGVPTPARFDGGERTPAPPLRTDWPRLFGSAELARLAAGAAADNLDVAAAAARIVQAQAQAETTSAAQFPQVTGNDSGQRSFTPATIRSATSNFGGRTAQNTFQLGLTASYEIDFWGRNAYASQAAEQSVVASRFARDTLVLSSVASIVNSYFTLLSAQDRIRIAQRDLKAAQDVLDAIKGRLAVGTVTALEVAQQESVVAQERALIPSLQLQADQARITMALLAGRTPESLHIAGGSLDRLRELKESLKL